MGRAPGVAAARSIATVVVLAGAVAAAAAARGAVPLPCPGRYVVIRGNGRLVREGVDGVVLATMTVTLGTRCTPVAARSRRIRDGWRLVTRAGACEPAGRVRLRARISNDCTLLPGTFGGQARGRFTAVESRCGDGIVDAGAGEQCDDGNTASGDGCEEYCLPCDRAAPPFSTTWAGIQRNVFMRHRCTGCHAAAASGGLELLADVAYGNLVGVPSVAVPTLPRVAPGDARASLLWLLLAKGSGAAGYDDVPGAGMPIGGRLMPDEVEAVGRWIDAGAPEEGVVPGTEPLLGACP